MELKEFTKETLLQIIDGVKDAQKEALEKNTIINPINIQKNNTEDIHIRIEDKDIQVTEIKFEVEVSTIDENGKEGGVGIFVGNFKFGGRKLDNDKAIATNKISFTVPVALPIVDYKENNTDPWAEIRKSGF